MREDHRRKFVFGAGALLAAPLTSFAQVDQLRRIGVLMSTAEFDPESRRRVAAFVQRLREAGWSDGRNAHIEYRWAAGEMDRIPVYSNELVRLRPDVILVLGPFGAQALRRETNTVPIVFVLVSDPVGRGLVSSLGKPGGNVTGFTNIDPAAGGKWIEILKELAPQVARIAVLFDPDTTPDGGLYMSPLRVAAGQLGVTAALAPVRNAAEIEWAITAHGREPRGGIVVLPNPVTETHRKTLIELVARERLPAVYPYHQYAVDGGLAAYGVDASDVFRRAAEYVNRILRGEKPGDLPAQQPAKFQFVINRRTAQALGLAISQSVLVRADEVIE